jgi:RNA polymerase sigma factor (sigma-70 family)
VLQATFLVLARRAGALERRPSLANWLYTVAIRLARKVCAGRRRRLVLEQRQETAQPRDPLAELSARELCSALDEEMLRLPTKYRTPIVLCCLQGKSRDEAAQELGWTPGAVKGRLERGRELLQRRLVRRGIELSMALGAGLLVERQAAAVSATLTSETTRAAAAFLSSSGTARLISPAAGLAHNFLQAAFLTKGLSLGIGLILLSLLYGAFAALNAGKPLRQEEASAPASLAATEEPQTGVDRYGDPLPQNALRRLGTVRFRHGGQIHAVACSPDGKTIASGGLGGLIRLWEAASGKPIGTLRGHRIHVFSLIFSADSQQLVSAGIDTPDHLGAGSVILWNVATKQPIFTVDHLGGVRCAALSADGRKIAMSCDDGTLLLLDAKTGKELHNLNKQQRLMNADAVTGQKQLKLSDAGHTRSLAFSPDGKVLASAQDGAGFDGDGSICLWELTSGKKLRTLQGHKGMILSVSFSPDGKQLASGGLHGTVMLWDVQTAKLLRTFRNAEDWIQGVTFAPNGQTLVAGSTDGRILMWDVPSGKERFQFEEHTAGFVGLALSPDGRKVATGSADQTIRLWNSDTGLHVATLRGHEKAVYTVEFARDGKHLLSAGGDGSVRLWNVADNREERRLIAPGESWNSRAVFSPSGKLLATGEVKLIRIWDSVTKKEIRQLKGHEGYVTALAWSPDEKLLVSTAHSFHEPNKPNEDWTVRLWDVASGAQLQRFPLLYAEQPAFRPDGRVVVCLAQGQMHYWEVFSGRPGPGPSSKDLMAFAYSPDGRWLATAHTGGTILVREQETEKEILRFDAGPAGVYKLVWSSDGKTLISANLDLTALIWDLTPPGWRNTHDLSGEGLERAWSDLQSSDAVRAYRAMWSLTATRDDAVTLIRERLRSSSGNEKAERIRRLVTDLDHDQFAKREAASKELSKLGREAEPALLEALANRPSAEVSERAKALLEGLASRPLSATPEQLLGSRAVCVLERIATAKARETLQMLSAHTPATRIAQEARAALLRLSDRTP